MIPEVTVWLSANGLPIAITKSPTSALLESASGISTRLFAVIFSSATSEGLSAADDLRLDLTVVEQRDGDFVGVLDDVRVGDDVAVACVDDHARAGALELPLARRQFRRIEEAAKERILEQRIAPLFAQRAAGRDVDHRGRSLLDDGRQRRHRRVADLLGQLCAGADAEEHTGRQRNQHLDRLLSHAHILVVE